MVRVHITGAVTVYTGTSPHGQGHETGFAQIVADRLGVDPEQVEVIHGDTGTGPQGLGTYGSRSLAVGGEAVVKATAKVTEKAKAIVAHKLEAAPEDVEVRDGKWIVRGSPESGLTLAEVAGMAYIPDDLPEDMEPGLEDTAFYDPSNFVFPFGAHAAIVDVDVETGKVKVVRYVAVDDCGPAINPMLIDGQIHGGIAHAHRPGRSTSRSSTTRKASSSPARSSTTRCPRRRAAELRDRPDRDPDADELARGQGHRRGRDDRRERRGHERGRRRPAPAGHHAPRHAADADAGVRPRSRRPGDDPRRVRLRRPGLPRRRARGAGRGRGGRQAPGRRPLARAAHEAAAGRARRCSSTCGASRACAAPSARTATGASAR